MVAKRGQQVEKLLSIADLAKVLGRDRSTAYRLVMRQLLDSPPRPQRPWAVRHGRSWRIKLSAYKATFVEFKDELFDPAQASQSIEVLAEKLGDLRLDVDRIVSIVGQRLRDQDRRFALVRDSAEKRDKAHAKIVSELRAEVRELRRAQKRRHTVR